MDLDLQNGQLYWSDLEQNGIYRTSLDADGDTGATVEPVLVDELSISLIHNVAIDVASQKLYFGYVNPLIDSLFPGAIGRVNVDGSQFETIVSGLSEPWDVALDVTHGKIYWTDTLLGRGGLIRRAVLDGSQPEDVIDNLKQPRGLALDASATDLFWVDAGTNRLQRANTDSFLTTDILLDLQQPTAIWLETFNLSGDFDQNGIFDIVDIDLLSDAVAAGSHQIAFDLNGDTLVDEADIHVWVHDLKNTWLGDADLDGQFDSSDLVAVLEAGKYEQNADASWAQGDWNGDRHFGTKDLVAALTDGGYEMGPRGAVTVVPEPTSQICLAVAFAAAFISARRTHMRLFPPPGNVDCRSAEGQWAQRINVPTQ